MNRISKLPEVRKKEILETAKKIFLEKGYEKTSMSDIAHTLNITQGLCYRYFKSKQELFETAIDEYADECSEKFIQVIESEDTNYKDKIRLICELMGELENPNRLDTYYNNNGKEAIHEQLELKVLMDIKESVKKFLLDLNNNGCCKKIDNVDSMNSFITYGIFGVLKCNDIDIREKINSIVEYLEVLLKIER